MNMEKELHITAHAAVRNCPFFNFFLILPGPVSLQKKENKLMFQAGLSSNILYSGRNYNGVQKK